MKNPIKFTRKLAATVQILAIALTLLTACTFKAPITICHATGSKTNPYTLIIVSADGLSGHKEHEGDIIPAPEDGCPKTSP